MQRCEEKWFLFSEKKSDDESDVAVLEKNGKSTAEPAKRVFLLHDQFNNIYCFAYIYFVTIVSLISETKERVSFGWREHLAKEETKREWANNFI